MLIELRAVGEGGSSHECRVSGLGIGHGSDSETLTRGRRRRGRRRQARVTDERLSILTCEATLSRETGSGGGGGNPTPQTPNPDLTGGGGGKRESLMNDFGDFLETMLGRDDMQGTGAPRS